MDVHAEELIKLIEEPKPKLCSVSEQDPRLTHKVHPDSAHRVDDMFRRHEGIEDAGIPLHNKPHPAVALKTEKPVHRLMAFAAAKGMSQTEMAQEFNYSKVQVSQICRQQWFQDLVTYFIAEAGGNQVEERIKSAGIDSVETLIELRDAPNTPASVKATVSMHLLDRLMGKPSQHVITEKKVPKDPAQEMEELDRKIAQINAATVKHN